MPRNSSAGFYQSEYRQPKIFKGIISYSIIVINITIINNIIIFAKKIDFLPDGVQTTEATVEVAV